MLQDGWFLVKMFNHGLQMFTSLRHSLKMESSTIFIIYSLLNVVIAQYCDSGQFDTIQGNCKFDCNYNGNYINMSSIPIYTIRKLCPSIDAAMRLYTCTIDDFVWPSDSCGCPYCKCTTQNSGGDISEIEYYKEEQLQKSCYNCTCSASSDSGITSLIYSCKRLVVADDPFSFGNFRCPPTLCIDSDGNERAIDESWFEQNTNDTLCEAFCYCSAEGTICETGFENILDNDVLATAFQEECGNAFDYYTKSV